MSILIVEDNKVAAHIVKLNLEKHGYHTIVVSNGMDALDILNNEDDEIDLVISDISMPYMDGIQFIKQIKQTPSYENIPVIFCTMHKDSEVIRTAIQLGCSDYIVKPVNAAQLLQKVRNILPPPVDEVTEDEA